MTDAHLLRRGALRPPEPPRAHNPSPPATPAQTQPRKNPESPAESNFYIPPQLYIAFLHEGVSGNPARKGGPKDSPETTPGKKSRKSPIWKAPRNPSPKRFLIRGVFLHKFLSGCLIYPRLMQLASRNRPRKINESLNYFSFNIYKLA